MRFVLLNQYYAPDEAATAQMAGDVGAELVRAGHEVWAICCDRSYGQPKRRYVRRETIEGVRIDRVRSTAFGRSTAIGRLADYLTFVLGAARRLLFGPRPDVVIALTTPPMIAYLALLIRRVRSFKLAFWSMDVYPDIAYELGAIKRGSMAGRFFTRTSDAVLRSSDVVIALGETMAARLGQLGASRVEVVHNWADGDAIVPRTANDCPPRADWGWQNRFVALYSGNLGLAHEFETVLSAARRLSSMMPDVLFAFVGVGPRLKEVREAARDLPNVEFRDYVDRSRLGDTLTAADLHLVTLRPNMPGLLVPSKIYGILAAGRPTIYVGPDAGEIAGILREGHCGASVRNGDIDGLVAIIAEYACDSIRRDREGENARALFERRFTRRKSLDAFRHIVEGLANSGVRVT